MHLILIKAASSEIIIVRYSSVRCIPEIRDSFTCNQTHAYKNMILRRAGEDRTMEVAVAVALGEPVASV